MQGLLIVLLALAYVTLLFVIASLAKESKAGKFGTFILFFVLAFGILGFVAKNVIQWVLGL